VIAFGIAFGLKYIGFEGTSFSLFFIIPVGAIITGALAGWGYPLAVKGYNRQLTKFDRYFVLLLAVGSFALLHYMYYKMTYVSSDMTFNYQFSGSHISEFTLKGFNEPLTFFNFMQFKIESTTISFTRRVVKPVLSISGNHFVNYLFFGIDALGFLIGFFAGYIGVKETSFCEECQKYMSTKKMFKVVDNFEEGANHLLDQITNGINGDAREFFNKYDLSNEALMNAYVEVEFDHCPDCSDAEATFSVYRKNQKGKFSQDTKSRKKHKISKERFKLLNQEFEAYTDNK